MGGPRDWVSGARRRRARGAGSALPQPAQPPAGPPQVDQSTPDGGAVPPSELHTRRESLAKEFAELQWDLGGIAYEMAGRDHFRLDVLIRQAAKLQQVDAELSEVERLLKLEQAGAAGACPSCGALYARGAAFCWQCGGGLMETGAYPAPTAASPDVPNQPSQASVPQAAAAQAPSPPEPMPAPAPAPAPPISQAPAPAAPASAPPAQAPGPQPPQPAPPPPAPPPQALEGQVGG
jgi:hypothetical protein